MNEFSSIQGNFVPATRFGKFSNDVLIDRLRFTDFDAPQFSQILRVLGDRLQAHLTGKAPADGKLASRPASPE